MQTLEQGLGVRELSRPAEDERPDHARAPLDLARHARCLELNGPVQQARIEAPPADEPDDHDERERAGLRPRVSGCPGQLERPLRVVRGGSEPAQHRQVQRQLLLDRRCHGRIGDRLEPRPLQDLDGRRRVFAPVAQRCEPAHLVGADRTGARRDDELLEETLSAAVVSCLREARGCSLHPRDPTAVNSHRQARGSGEVELGGFAGGAAAQGDPGAARDPLGRPGIRLLMARDEVPGALHRIGDDIGQAEMERQPLRLGRALVSHRAKEGVRKPEAFPAADQDAVREGRVKQGGVTRAERAANQRDSRIGEGGNDEQGGEDVVIERGQALLEGGEERAGNLHEGLAPANRVAGGRPSQLDGEVGIAGRGTHDLPYLACRELGPGQRTQDGGHGVVGERPEGD